ncbi:MAG: hypothetical protein K8T89_06705 [Planctomycetes bacterium]|nr:hypothetical protein [Planctomycetota bacterium]
MIQGETRFGLQFLPTILGVGWLLCWAYQSREKTWDWSERMPMLLLVSFVTASYGAWPFDLIILLPAVLAVAAALARRGDSRLVRLGLLFWGIINGTALALNLLKTGSFSFIVIAPMMLLAYLVLIRCLRCVKE